MEDNGPHFVMRSSFLPLLLSIVAFAAVIAQPVTFEGLQGARAATAGPATRPTSAGLQFDTSSNHSSVPAGQGMDFGMSDRLDRVTARAPNGVTLILTRSEATWTASGTLPVAANVTADGEAHATGSGRLHLDSQAIVNELLNKMGGSLPSVPGAGNLPALAGSAPDFSFDAGAHGRADGTIHAEGGIDNVQGSAEIGKKTEGVLVGVPIAGGLSFFGGAKKVDEYVVVAVQGFDYHYNVHARANGSATLEPTGQTLSAGKSYSASGGGHVPLNLSATKQWEYTVAVVGIGYRGDHGGFHALVDLDWSKPKLDPDGYLDVGPLKRLQMPGPVRDAELGGDFRVHGFSAGANVKLFTFAGYAVGTGLDMFVCQEFSAVDIGISYKGEARGLMADQNAALEVGFKPVNDVKITLIGGVRVLSSYVPGFNSSFGKQVGAATSGTFGNSGSAYGQNYNYSGTYSASGTASGQVTANQPATLTNVVTYAPGIKVDLLSSGFSIGGGPILDSNGKVVGGEGTASYEVVKDRMELGISGASYGPGNAGGALNLGVRF